MTWTGTWPFCYSGAVCSFRSYFLQKCVHLVGQLKISLFLVTVATVPFSLWVYLLVVLVPISFYFADLWLLVSCFPFSEARA